ncbi:MAG TPA: NifU family protein [Bryobacteraceae bacterium]|nr:NifU family protein [Bryobacteraceae bacterium]
MRENFHERIARIEGLVRQLEASGDPACRSCATELVESLMDLHGAGIERMLEIVAETAGERSAGIIDLFGRDSLVSSLLVLYGIHPESLETRVRRGVDQLAPFLRSRGVTLDVLEVTDGTVRLRVQTPAEGCGSTAGTVKSTVEETISEFAPDANGLIIEGLQQQVPMSGFVPLEALSGPAK